MYLIKQIVGPHLTIYAALFRAHTTVLCVRINQLKQYVRSYCIALFMNSSSTHK